MAADLGLVLAVEDDEETLLGIESALSAAGYRVLLARNGEQALAVFDTAQPDLVLTDLNMPGLDGYEVVSRLKADKLWRYIPIIILSANSDLADVLRGLEAGADDYIKKPFRAAELVARVATALRLKKLYSQLRSAREENERLSTQLGERHQLGGIVGSSSAMQGIFDLVRKVADSDVPVLITGESGTGKELVARALHFDSVRRQGPFVAQNCSAFADTLLESELFGHVRGSFTGALRDKSGVFEAADNGTLFLDELGEMSPAMQVKLLRVLQDGSFNPVGSVVTKKVNVRVVGATNRDLRKMVSAGAFREDLFYRINVVNINLPPLRERRSDIRLLAEFFLDKIAQRTQQPRKNFSNDLLLVLSDYNWPGNVRELENEIERLVVFSGTSQDIGLETLSKHILETSAPQTGGSGRLPDAIQELEREYIQKALVETGGNKSEAARLLGIARSSLISKCQLFGLG